MTLTPNDWAIGLGFLIAALLIIRRDIVEWYRETRTWLQIRKANHP